MKKTERKRRRIRLATRGRPRCVVQFNDDVELPEGRFDGEQLLELELGPARALLKRFPGLVFSPVFSRRADKQADERRARRNGPRRENFRYVDGPWATEFDALAGALGKWRTVRGAQVDHPSRDPVFVPGPPVNHPDLRLGNQLYLNPAPRGVDAKYAWRFPGGDGAGVTFADVERGWKRSHPDFDNFTSELVRGDNFYDSKDHGAGILGIVCAGAGNDDPDLFNGAGGIVGIANGVTDVKLSGIIEKLLVTESDLAAGDSALSINLMLLPLGGSDPDYEGAAEAFSRATGIPASAITEWVQWDSGSSLVEALSADEWTIWHSENVSDAIDVAASHLLPGDVLLVETQENVLPEEVVDVVYESIRDAVDAGIVVIEVAGNGGQNLDLYGGDTRILFRAPGNPDFRDSGAIMVGGSKANEPPDLPERHVMSNHGQRVDCFAWAEHVYTADANNYDWAGSGTSAAGAIIAGVALVVQGMLDAAGEDRLTPGRMRDLLRNLDHGTHAILGTPPGTPVADVGAAWYAGPAGIGVMPDLRALIDDSLGLTASVMMRRFISDAGHELAVPPHQYKSPDIFVRDAASPPSASDFGWGSGTENDMGISITPVHESDALVFARVSNPGGADAVDVRVAFYHGLNATFVGSDQWKPLGAAELPLVAGMSKLEVSSAVPWPGGQVPKHPASLIAVVGTDAVPPLPREHFSTLEQHMLGLEQRMVVVRNHHRASTTPDDEMPETDDVIFGIDITPGDDPVDVTALPFVIAGAPNEHLVMKLEVGTAFPDGCHVFIELPKGPIPPSLTTMIISPPGDFVYVPVPRMGHWQSADMGVPAGLRQRLRLLVEIPPDRRDGTYGMHAAQTVDGVEIGRITWEIAP